MRTAIKEDLNTTAAEMVYGTGIWLPVEFFIPTKQHANSEYASRLKGRIEKIRPHREKKHRHMYLYAMMRVEAPYNNPTMDLTRLYSVEKRLSTSK